MKNGNGEHDPPLRTQAQDQVSPFFHASSPSKLKELLQQNSLRKVQERNSPIKEITPRTKARKRLTGEIEETPAKSRARRKRGAGMGAVPDIDVHIGKGLNGLSNRIRVDEDEQIEDEDEFGPTPIKSRQPESFHSLFELDNGTGTSGPAAGPSRSTDSLSRSSSSNLVGRLLAAGGKGKGKGKAVDPPPTKNGNEAAMIPISPAPEAMSTPDVAALDDLANGADAEDQMVPPWEDEQDDMEAPSEAKEPPRPDKTVSISDDELDEWDPEASHVRHRVRIVPTRSRPTKRWSDSDDQSDGVDDGPSEGEEEVDSDHETLPPLDESTTSQTAQVQSPPQLLSLLSLTSPNQRQGRYARLKELRYKALFNPSGSDARKLKAFTKGQEAFVAGEVVENQDEEGDLEEVEVGDRADDDWESESDGWNRTGVEMDDDAW
jgi:hypothetical protein